MTPLNSDSSFNEKGIFLLEAAAGIPVKRTLKSYTQQIQTFLGITYLTDINLNRLLNYWISDVQWVRPTWKNLLLIICLLNLDDLAQRMETYLSGGTEEPHENPEMEMEDVTEGKESKRYNHFFEYLHDIVIIVGGEVESQLQSQDQVIYHLKQEMASLKEEKDATIFTLEEKIKELESRVQIEKEDGISLSVKVL